MIRIDICFKFCLKFETIEGVETYFSFSRIIDFSYDVKNWMNSLEDSLLNKFINEICGAGL